jgi:hypothetical protein
MTMLLRLIAREDQRRDDTPPACFDVRSPQPRRRDARERASRGPCPFFDLP